MRIYVAAPFAARAMAVEIAASLENAGHEITSTWHGSTRDITEGTVGLSADSTDEEVEAHAQGDLNDIDRAHAVLHLTSNYVREYLDVPHEWLTTGGRHVESGYALAKGKAVHILGEPENVFARAFAFQHPTVDAFLEYVAQWGDLTAGD